MGEEKKINDFVREERGREYLDAPLLIKGKNSFSTSRLFFRRDAFLAGRGGGRVYDALGQS